MVMMFNYLSLSLSCLSPLWLSSGSPFVYFLFSLSALPGFPPGNVGFINVNIVKCLQRCFNIEIGTLFV